MARVKGSLPNLVNGISQQPPSLRRASQAEAQVNGFSGIVEGLTKRAPTHSVAKVHNGTLDDAFMHTINRDTAERYDVIVTNGAIQVFDAQTGEEKIVTVEEADGYLEAATPSESFRAVTIADYTFIVNTGKIVRVHPQANKYGFNVFRTTNAAEVGAGHEYTIYLDYQEGTLADDLMGGTIAWNGVALTATVISDANDTVDSIADKLNTELQTGDSRFGFFFLSDVIDNQVLVGGLQKPNGNLEPIEGRFIIDGEEMPIRSAETEADHTVTSLTAKGEVVTQIVPTVALFYIKQGNYGTEYRVELEEQSGSNTFFQATKTTSNTVVTDIGTTKIASDLYNTLVAINTFNTYYTATVSGSLIKCVRNDRSVFRIRTHDGNGNKNVIGILDTVQSFADLPATCFDGFTTKVSGDNSAEEDDYYVQFEGPHYNTASEGVWNEVGQVAGPNEFRAETMPHQLVRQANGTFKFQQADWALRNAGDEGTNLAPSFVGKTMTDLYFFRNRLGVLTDDKVVMTEAGGFFNFWRKTVQTILDSDRIDIAASSTKVAILRYAAPFSEKLILFSDQQQFVLSAGDLLTPKTVSIKPSTAFETLDARAVVAGRNIYFPTPRGDDFAGLREYLVDKDTQNDDAADVTSHTPAFLPSGVFKLATAPNEDVVIGLARDEPSRIYAYRFYWSGNDKLQSAWSYWDLGDEEAEVLHAEFLNSTLHLLVQRPDGVYIETMGVEPNRADVGLDFEVLLDRRITDEDCDIAYNATTDVTEITLPYAEANVHLVVREDSGEYRKLGLLTATRPTNTTVEVLGDVSEVPLWIGKPYTFEYELSELFIRKKDPTTGGESIITGRRLQIIRGKILFSKTGYFRVEVIRNGRTWTYPFTTFTLGEALIGTQELKSGEFRFPVMAKSDKVRIRIINDSHLPCRFQSIEWRGTYSVPAKEIVL